LIYFSSFSFLRFFPPCGISLHEPSSNFVSKDYCCYLSFLLPMLTVFNL
jgi:hypothetical protein